MSPLAKEACEIVGRIKDEEQKTIWTSEFENALAQETGANIYPGMMFSLAKDRMEKTKLWQIVRKMPKGALLHAHMDAMVDYEFLFEVLLSTPGMHIYCATPISTPQQLEVAPVSFRFLKTEHGMPLFEPVTPFMFTNRTFTVNGKSIWTPEYVPNTPILLTKAVEDFPNGGKAGFLSWLTDRLTITNAESLEHHHGVDAVWRKFQNTFIILKHIIFYEPIFKKASIILMLGSGALLTVYSS